MNMNKTRDIHSLAGNYQMVITIREMCVKGFTQVKVIARVHLGHMVQYGVDILEDLLIPNAASHLLDAIYFF